MFPPCDAVYVVAWFLLAYLLFLSLYKVAAAAMLLYRRQAPSNTAAQWATHAPLFNNCVAAGLAIAAAALSVAAFVMATKAVSDDSASEAESAVGLYIGAAIVSIMTSMALFNVLLTARHTPLTTLAELQVAGIVVAIVPSTFHPVVPTGTGMPPPVPVGGQQYALHSQDLKV